MHSEPSTFPAALGDIFSKLSTGYHLCIDDGDTYQSLAEDVGYYRSLFDVLGYKLSDGADGIFYFLPVDDKLNEISKRFTAFMAVMYDWLADNGKEPVTSLTGEHFHIDELPHLAIDQYRKIMLQLDVSDEKEIAKIVNALQKHGFLVLVDGSLIKFRKSVSRFVSMFTEVADREDAQSAEGVSDE